MLNQPRDANGCFSRRQPARRSSLAGTEDSWSLVRLRAFGTVLDNQDMSIRTNQRSAFIKLLLLCRNIAEEIALVD